jgi:hypothetical protein
MVAVVDVAKKEVIPKKTGFTSGGIVTTVGTHTSAAGRGSPSIARGRSPSPVKKRPRVDAMIFNGSPTFWLHYSPQKKEFMDESYSAWNTDMTAWACPSTETSVPHPWKSQHGRQEFGNTTCELWEQACTVMCEAHTRPENVINECYDLRSGGSAFEWLHQPTNRQRPPQNVQQLRISELFPQTLRLPDPKDAHVGKPGGGPHSVGEIREAAAVAVVQFFL